MINGVPRILLVRLSAIGDVVRVMPALHGLREAFPNAQIDWAVERLSADLLEGHPDLDSVLVFDRTRDMRRSAAAFWRFCKQVRAGRYDIVVDFHGILKSGILAYFSGAAERAGFAQPRAREASYLFTNKKVTLPARRLSRVEENLLLAETLGAKNPSEPSAISVPHEIQEEVDEFFDASFDSGKWVVAMHVPVERPEKQWPPGYFSQLADLLLADGRFDVLLTWGPGQFEQAEKVAVKARRHPKIAPEMPTLRHYAWLAHHAHLYFGGDTGPMHIASVMGTPVVAVFGGTDPAQHAPCRKPFEALGAAQDAGAGNLDAAEKRLRAITPEMAYDACIRMMAQCRRG